MLQLWTYNARKKSLKNRKFKISEIQKRTFVTTFEKKIQEKFWKDSKAVDGGVPFWTIGSHGD